jgi:hypothetical protein
MRMQSSDHGSARHACSGTGDGAWFVTPSTQAFEAGAMHCLPALTPKAFSDR